MKKRILLLSSLIIHVMFCEAQITDTTDRIADTINIQDVDFPVKALPSPRKIKVQHGKCCPENSTAAGMYHVLTGWMKAGR